MMTNISSTSVKPLDLATCMFFLLVRGESRKWRATAGEVRRPVTGNPKIPHLAHLKPVAVLSSSMF
ncbi:hypothetical protein L0Y59_03615 [Candidatus Uhrbacteria bacterium]|nr:hypothetical protein [Candidatus Uhrbacteria bacterium]